MYVLLRSRTGQIVLIAVLMVGLWLKLPEHLFVFSPNTGKCGKNAKLNNSEYGHFLRSVFVLRQEPVYFIESAAHQFYSLCQTGTIQSLF